MALRWFSVLFGAYAAAHPFVDGAEADVPALEDVLQARQTCSGPVASNPSTWWRAAIQHNGTTPMSTDSTYQYYRTAVQYGADNTGVNDASGAFNFAINAWSRAGNTVTTRPAYVYVPPGTYRIKSPIQLYVSTYLIGDPLNPPRLIADPALGTNPVINAYDSLQGDGSATKNFYMSIRNLVIDTTEIATNVQARGIDYSVSQGCSMNNVKIRMPNFSSHIGITMNNGGSGTIISDCSFEGGAIGIRLQNQQYHFKGLSFNGCNVGISINSVFVASFQGMTFQNCNFGVDMGRSGSTGSVSLIDSKVSACNAGVNAAVTGGASGSLVIDGFQVASGTAGVKAPDGSTLLAGGVPTGQTWVMGNVNSGNWQRGTSYPINRPASLLSSGGQYFTMPAPQYEQYALDQIISIKGDPQFPVYGDHQHDDGPNINALLRKYANCKIVFFPQGLYLTRSTIYVPPGSRLVGEVLSVITANGSAFWNPADPQPVLQVGRPGDRGVAQISDLLVQTSDVLQGAILAQVNMVGNQPGDVGMWNTVLRVGGSKESLVNTNCGGPDPAACKAAFALLHVTSSAGSTYLENVWGWVADHSLDGGAAGGQNIAVGRGALIESKGPTWLVGTSFEHCVLYQYSLSRAANVFIAMEQTEAPYWQGQGTPRRAPAPWTANATYGDPTFSNCASQGQGNTDVCFRAWGHHMSGSSNIVIHASALWVFFNKMNDNKWQDAGCDTSGGICEYNMAFVSSASSTFWYGLGTKSSTNMIYDAGVSTVTQGSNQGGWGGALAAYLRDAGI